MATSVNFIPPTTRNLWTKQRSFVVFQPLEVLDTIFPNTPGHLKRLAERATKQNQKKGLYTPTDEWIFPMNKGQVSSLARIALIMGYTTTNNLTHPPNGKHTNPEFISLQNDFSPTFTNPQIYSNPNLFRLDRVAYFYAITSGVHPVMKDIPEEAHAWGYTEWAIAIFKACCDVTLTTSQAYAVMAESYHIRRTATDLGVKMNKYYQAEDYVFNEIDGEILKNQHIHTAETQEQYDKWVSETRRPMLQSAVQEDAVAPPQSLENAVSPETICDTQKNHDISQFKCSIPYSTLDGLDRMLCATCGQKQHIYCPDCLQWCVDLTQITDSSLSGNYLSSLWHQNAPYHPKAIAQLHINEHSVPSDPQTSPSLQQLQQRAESEAITKAISRYEQPASSLLTELSASLTQSDLSTYLPAYGLPLPLYIDLMHHPQEKLSKSTGLHSVLVAPAQARIVSFPTTQDVGTERDYVPTYDEESTVILYPTEDALSPEEIDWRTIKRCVIVEATWQCTNQILTHPKLRNLKKIKLQSYNTLFWRNQNFGSQYLATIEAIYYLAREVHCAMIKQMIVSPSTIQYFYQQQQQMADKLTAITEYKYAHEIDDLLLLFLIRLYRVMGKYKEDLKNDSVITTNASDCDAVQSTNTQMPRTWKQGLVRQ